MLIKCPECELQVSDKALSCPHCGYPLKSPIRTRGKQKKKHRKLPNGFGRISELHQNLSNPFRAMVTVGKDQFGHPIGSILGYYKTYNLAYEALVEYNKNPYDLSKGMTVAQLYEAWTDEYFDEISLSSKRTINASWVYCSDIYNMKARDLRVRHIKGCMQNGFRIETRGAKKGEKIFATASTKARIKSMFNLMLDYGLEYEIVDKNYARDFEISGEIVRELERSKRDHIIFTPDEIQILWNNIDKPFVDMVLIHIYSGWRPQELAILKLKNVDLDNWTFSGGMKTDAGINRIIPIHSKIRHLVKRNYEKAQKLQSEYLFNAKGQTHAGKWNMTYDKYANRYKEIILNLALNPKHKPHDPRKTFITLAKKNNLDEYAIKYLVGHSIQDITERVYTEREISWLQSEIEKIN